MVTSTALVILSHARQQWLQVLWVIAAIGIGCAGLSSVLMLNQAAQQDYQLNSQQWLGINFSKPLTAHIVPKPELSTEQHLRLYSNLRKAGFTGIVANQTATFDITVAGEIKRVTAIGIDAPALASLMPEHQPDFLALSGIKAVSDALYTALENTPQLFDPHPTLSALTALPTVNLSQIDRNEYVVIVDLHHFANLGIALKPEFLVFEPVERQVVWQTLINNQANVRPVVSVGDAIASTRSFHLSLLALSMVMFLVCLFIVVNALNLLLSQRLPLLRTLRQLGLSRRLLFLLQLFELCVYATISTFVGLALGYHLSLLLVPAVSTTLTALYRVNVDLFGISGLNLILPLLCTSLIATVLAAIFPLRQLNQQLRFKTHHEQPSNPKILIGLLTLCAFVSIGLVNLPPSTESAYLMIAVTLIAGILFLFAGYPLLLRLFATLTSPNRRGVDQSVTQPSLLPIMHWSIAHSEKLAKHSRLAIAAFFIALVTHIGMNLMVDSFRTATMNWLEGRLVADYYVSGDQQTLEQASDMLDERGIQHFQRLQTNMDVIVNTSHQLRHTAVYGYPTDKRYLEGLTVHQALPDAVSIFVQGAGVFINQQMAFRHGIALNEHIQLGGPDRTKSYQVVGIHHDYGNTQEQILLATPALLRWSKNAQFKLKLNGLSAHSTSLTELESTLQPVRQSLNLLSRADILKLSVSAFNTTFKITDALNLITLLVAVLSLVTSIILLQKQNQLSGAILRSLGVSRLTITACLFGQYMLIVVLTALFAIPFGIILGWLLVSRLNIAAFNWLFPLQISWSAMAIAVSVSLLLTALIALWPIVKTQRFSVKEQLQCAE